MFQNMFDRLLALFMVVILLVALIGGAFSMVSVRSSMADSRMETLMGQAREIAFLASRMDSGDPISDFLDIETSTMSYLQWKAQTVYEDYNAYILILDRNGRVMDNMQSVVSSGANALETLDAEAVSQALRQVLSGQEVQTRILSSSGPVFSVAVPWMQNDQLLGAVFIHTSAQIIEAEYQGLLLQMAVGFALASLVAIAGTAFYARGIVRPLTVITNAAEDMSKGKLSTRAEVTGVNEVRQLAGAFNVMAEKLEEVEESRREFVANVSHELRSPVTSIHGFVEGMLDGLIPHEDYPRYLQIVFDETNRMKRLIADLLQLSRMDKGVEQLVYSDFDINELIRRVIIGRMNDIEEKRLHMQVDFFEEPCLVHADSDRISQVVHNIVDNALKYVPDEGSLTITTTLLHDSMVAVAIENEGVPISPQDRAHLFERFYKVEKAHTSGGGTGLGLSICKQIMQLHGQSIEVLPLDKGAGFQFTLQLTRKYEPAKLESH